MQEIIDSVYVFRHGTVAEWEAKNPILRRGEPGVADDDHKFKIGDGVTPWNELSYYLDQDDITILVNAAIAASPGGGGGVTSADLIAHINSLTPHPVYDDGPSLDLLYQNAKV